MNNDAVAQELVQGPKPISISVSTNDVQALFACGTSPDQYNQLLLAKLRDAGAPVEGTLRLRLAHGKLFKMKDSVMQEQSEFTYLWLPDGYVEAIGQVGRA
jgi:hypothetical protein